MFVPIGAFPDASAATEAAKTLVGQGIGAQPDVVRASVGGSVEAAGSAGAAPDATTDAASATTTGTAGDAPTTDAPPGDAATGDAATGDAPTTDAPTGVAATGDVAAGPAGGAVGEADRWVVQVLVEDAVRACEVLGLDPPEAVPEPEPPRAPWKLVLLIWLAALIIIPLLAFFITINVAS